MERDDLPLTLDINSKNRHTNKVIKMEYCNNF